MKEDKGKHMEINKQWRIKCLEISFRYRSSKCWMGRFGGGWQWGLGVDIGSTSILIKLLICSLIFHVSKLSTRLRNAGSQSTRE